MTIKEVTITPEIASKLLENNDINRSLSQDRVSRYARDMKAGNWKLTSQGISLNKSGKLIDGQHRLYAVIKSGATIKSLVFYDCEDETILNYDSGMARTFGDYLHISGVDHSKITAGVVAQIMRKTDDSPRYSRASQNELNAFYAANKSDVDATVRFAYNTYHSAPIKLMKPSEIGFLFWTLGRTQQVADFIFLVISGVGIFPDTSALQIRRVLEQVKTGERRLTFDEVLNLWRAAWARRFDKNVKLLRPINKKK